MNVTFFLNIVKEFQIIIVTMTMLKLFIVDFPYKIIFFNI